MLSLCIETKMKANTTKLFLILWLSSFNIVILPIAGDLPRNKDGPGVEDSYKELKLLIKSGRQLVGKRDFLRLSYNEWFRVTKEMNDSLYNLHDEIIKVNTAANYASLLGSAVSIAGGVIGIVGAVPTGGWSLVVTGASIGGLSVRVGSGLRRYSESKEMCNIAVKNIETTKRYTEMFHQRLLSYIDSLDEFINLLSSIRLSEGNTLQFYETARKEEFFNNPNSDIQSEEKLREFLTQIIKSDLSKIKPKLWLFQFIKNAYDISKDLKENVDAILSELKSTFSDDPLVYVIFIDTIKVLYDEWTKNKLAFGDDTPFIGSSSESIPAVPLALSELTELDKSIAEPSKLLKGNADKVKSVISKTMRIAKDNLETVKVVLVAIEIIYATNTIRDLYQGSKSVESEQLVEFIKMHSDKRDKIIHMMGEKFGW